MKTVDFPGKRQLGILRVLSYLQGQVWAFRGQGDEMWVEWSNLTENIEIAHKKRYMKAVQRGTKIRKKSMVLRNVEQKLRKRELGGKD